MREPQNRHEPTMWQSNTRPSARALKNSVTEGCSRSAGMRSYRSQVTYHHTELGVQGRQQEVIADQPVAVELNC